MGQLGPRLRVSPGWNQGVNRSCDLIGDAESSSKLLTEFSFLGSRRKVSIFLMAVSQGHSRLLKTALPPGPCQVDPSLLNTAACFYSGQQKSISPTLHRPLKGSSEQVRPIQDNLIFTGLAHPQEEEINCTVQLHSTPEKGSCGPR